MNKKTTARRTTKRKKRTTRKTAARNAAPAVSGRKYELVGLVLFALGLISLLGLFGLSVGPFGTYFAKVLHYMAKPSFRLFERLGTSIVFIPSQSAAGRVPS